MFTESLPRTHAQLAAALAAHRLAAFGWAPCSRMPTDAFAALYPRLDQLEASTADAELTTIWSGTELWDGTLRRVQPSATNSVTDTPHCSGW
jgi:hypothetical protein